MQNRYKFRAWDNREKEMVYNVHLDPDNWLEELIEEPQDGDVLMQYTGLKDKNGKDIYEGDVVLASDEEKYKVCCDVWLCMGIMPLMGRGFVSFTELAGQENGLNFEIVGNIYESDLSTSK